MNAEGEAKLNQWRLNAWRFPAGQMVITRF